MLECKFYSNTAISHRKKLQFFENCFELPLASSTNVIKQVFFKYCYITTFPFVVDGWGGGKINNKANSVKFKLKLPV